MSSFGFLRAAEPMDAFGVFRAEVKKEADALPAGPSEKRNNVAKFQSVISTVEQAIVQRDPGGAVGLLDQLAATPGVAPSLQASARKLREDLPRLIEKQDEDFVTQVDDAIKKTGEAALAAKKEDDLYPLQSTLSALNQARRTVHTSPAARRALTKLQAANNFIPRWQDFLAQSAAGNADAARNALRSLLDGTDNAYPILTRPQIEARLKALAPTEESDFDPVETLRKIKKLEDMPSILETLKKTKLPSGQSDAILLNALIDEMNRLNGAYAALQQGFYGQAFQGNIAWGKHGCGVDARDDPRPRDPAEAYFAALPGTPSRSGSPPG